MNELLQALAWADRHAAAQADYHKSLILLRALKGGGVTLDQVAFTDGGWTVSAPQYVSGDKCASRSATFTGELNGDAPKDTVKDLAEAFKRGAITIPGADDE